MRYNTLLFNVVRGLETEAVESGLSESDARKHVADTLRKLYESYKG